MKSLCLTRIVVAGYMLAELIGCGGGGSSSPVSTPPPSLQQGSAQASISLHDMPPVGLSILSFQSTITGMTLQPGNVSVLSSPMTLEMTQLQGLSAYMGTVSLPVGTYTGMTVTLSNPQMTFLNNSGGTMFGGGMMGESGCASGQVCQVSPTMMASSVTVTGTLFPLNVQANTPFDMQMDFDLMDSLQSNMGMNPMMSSMMQQTNQGSSVLDDMDDMIGQISSVGSSNNQFTMLFVQGMPSMIITADANTTFLGFDGIGKPNSFAGLAQGQIVLARMQLMAGGNLHAERVRFESNAPQVLDGMIVAVNSPTQFDMVMTNDAPAIQGLNFGELVRINMQAGGTFDVGDTELPISGMSFAGSSDMMVGQVVQIEPASGLVSGPPPQFNTKHVRLMKTWMTAKVASIVNADTFTLQSLPALMGMAGISTMTVSTSAQSMFENVTNVAALNVGDTVSVRGPMFTVNGAPAIIASKIMKR
jgi:Domain of unknown function (DUF5666)